MIGIGLEMARPTAVSTPPPPPSLPTTAVSQVLLDSTETVPVPTLLPTRISVSPVVVTPVPASTPIPPLTPTPTPMPLPVLENPIDEKFAATAQEWFADFLRLDAENSGVQQYQANNFVHPIALEIDADMAYLLDAGRVLAINLETAVPPQVLLAPDDLVENVRVLEPVDLALMSDFLLVLDRAGDVYLYDLAAQTWTLDRYDRPVEASSGHYFVAIDAPNNYAADDPAAYVRSLLEINYQFVSQYGNEAAPLWNLPEARGVDVSALGDKIFVLQREMHDAMGAVYLYQDTRHIKTFQTRFPIENPLQLVATETAVFVLDQEGRRLLAFDPLSGGLLQIYQLVQEDPISVFWADNSGQRLIFAGRDKLYLWQQPEHLAAIPGGDLLSGVQPHDPTLLAGLTEYGVPIGGSNITFRDFQLPGAPRHYRLGVHNGIDFYWQPGTDIIAAADGVIVRADVDYIPPTAAQLAAWWNESQALGYTSDETLDRYLGRQVWIEHANGVVSRHAHLRMIEPGIVVGTAVTRGQKIGEVGNSGSPASLESETSDAHLHFELWLDENAYLGQFLRPIETRMWIERILSN
ncbi:MAG: M23 family metallopeptidase [Anaerolineales bacterium]|nr:M23 family metallopeptidase [Anaerolineales bacterium]